MYLHCTPETVANVRKRFAEQGFEGALARKPRAAPPVPPIFDGEKEARLITLACSSPPEGRSRWTLQLLADTLVELKIVESVSPSTICRVLKNELKPHLHQSWVIPPEENGEFVVRMEDIIDLYQRPYDPEVPVICMDKKRSSFSERSRHHHQ
jgi:hypothetical protein